MRSIFCILVKDGKILLTRDGMNWSIPNTRFNPQDYEIEVAFRLLEGIGIERNEAELVRESGPFQLDGTLTFVMFFITEKDPDVRDFIWAEPEELKRFKTIPDINQILELSRGSSVVERHAHKHDFMR